MSYIRSTSNPEKLYIYTNVETVFMWNIYNPETVTINTNDFHNILNHCIKDTDEKLITKTIEYIPPFGYGNHSNKVKLILNGDIELYLYTVTWESVVNYWYSHTLKFSWLKRLRLSFKPDSL